MSNENENAVKIDSTSLLLIRAEVIATFQFSQKQKQGSDILYRWGEFVVNTKMGKEYRIVDIPTVFQEDIEEFRGDMFMPVPFGTVLCSENVLIATEGGKKVNIDEYRKTLFVEEKLCC